MILSWYYWGMYTIILWYYHPGKQWCIWNIGVNTRDPCWNRKKENWKRPISATINIESRAHMWHTFTVRCFEGSHTHSPSRNNFKQACRINGCSIADFLRVATLSPTHGLESTFGKNNDKKVKRRRPTDRKQQSGSIITTNSRTHNFVTDFC